MRTYVAVMLVLGCSACTSASTGPRTTVVTVPEGLPGDDTVVYPPVSPPYRYIPPISAAPIDDASADTDSALIDVVAAGTNDAGLDARGDEATADTGADSAADAIVE